MMGLMVIFLWLPVHHGVKGNEMTEGKAKEATKRPLMDMDISVSRTDIENRIRHKNERNVTKAVGGGDERAMV